MPVVLCVGAWEAEARMAGVWEAKTEQSQRAHEISFYWRLPMCSCAKDFMCLTLYTPFMNPTRQLCFCVC